MKQEQKHNYLENLYRVIRKQDGFDSDQFSGAVFVESGDEYIYCGPGVQQYFGGMDFPEDHNVKISISIQNTDGEDVYVNDLNYQLTFNADVDLANYLKVVKAWRTTHGK